MVIAMDGLFYDTTEHDYVFNFHNIHHCHYCCCCYYNNYCLNSHFSSYKRKSHHIVKASPSKRNPQLPKQVQSIAISVFYDAFAPRLDSCLVWHYPLLVSFPTHFREHLIVVDVVSLIEIELWRRCLPSIPIESCMFECCLFWYLLFVFN